MKAFTLFVSRDAMNIDGMSEATLENSWATASSVSLPIFSVSTATATRLWRWTVSVKIIPESDRQHRAREKHNAAPSDFRTWHLKYRSCKRENDLQSLRFRFRPDPECIGGGFRADRRCRRSDCKSIVDYFADEENKERLERLLSYLTIEKPQASQEEQKLAGLTFVITGSVEHFPNRNALKARIEELGGKATGSVTGKTSYLINNDTTSSSSKTGKHANSACR